MRRVLPIVIVLALALVGWRVWAARSHRETAQVRVPTAEVVQGPLVVTLPVTGALESAQETPVRAEIAGSLIQICADNSPVKPGDFVYQLDTKDLVAQQDDAEQALTDAQEALNTAESDGQTNIAQAESEVVAAQEALKLAQEQAAAQREKVDAQVKYAEGQTARAKRELERSQRLAKLNYIAGTRLRDAEKAYRAQEFSLTQQKAQQADVTKRSNEQVQDQQRALELAQHSLDTSKASTESGIVDARIRVSDAQRRLGDLTKKIEQCTVRASAAGLAVIETNTENWPERRPYRLGDQVGAGMAPVRVYDFTKMQVRCQIGEMDIPRVHEGQEALVVSSAQTGRRYRGKVAVVEELAQDSNVMQGGTPGKKVFGLLITLNETDPAHLRPGMTVDLEIVLDEVRQAVQVPIRAVFKEGTRSVVYRAEGNDFRAIPVTVGKRNDLLVEVRGELRPGARVALERPPARVSGRVEARS